MLPCQRAARKSECVTHRATRSQILGHRRIVHAHWLRRRLCVCVWLSGHEHKAPRSRSSCHRSLLRRGRALRSSPCWHGSALRTQMGKCCPCGRRHAVWELLQVGAQAVWPRCKGAQRQGNGNAARRSPGLLPRSMLLAVHADMDAALPCEVRGRPHDFLQQLIMRKLGLRICCSCTVVLHHCLAHLQACMHGRKEEISARHSDPQVGKQCTIRADLWHSLGLVDSGSCHACDLLILCGHMRTHQRQC